jgi:hypothetical protein
MTLPAAPKQSLEGAVMRDLCGAAGPAREWARGACLARSSGPSTSPLEPTNPNVLRR